ncbi:MAG: PKD domain-containing protein [Planctomycetota bacterium]
MMNTRKRWYLAAICAVVTFGGLAVGAGSAEEVALPSPPQEIVDMANAITWRYYYGHNQSAHTNDAHGCGRQFTLGIAAHADNTTADYRFFRQVRYNLEGAYCIVAAGGYGSQHELIFTGSCALIKHNPRLWGELTADEQHKMNLLMKAALVASAYTTSDDGYADGQNTDLMGGTNLGRGWNPNFREGMIGTMCVATAYFGGGAAADAILDNYDHAAFCAELDAAGLTNTHITFNYKVDNPGSNAPTGAMIEADIDNYRYLTLSLSQLMDIYGALTTFTYDKNINTGLNDGAGYDGGGYMMDGQDGLPNIGALGMLHELDGSDGSGPRSSITYAYFGYRPNLISQVVLLTWGYWQGGTLADTCVSQMDVGVLDLFYKLDFGYMNYANGKADGPTYMTDSGWDFYMTKSWWYDVVAPYHHDGANQPPVADAGDDQTVTDSDENGTEDVTLDGSGSYDADGTIAGYVWEENAVQIATGVSPTVTLDVNVHTIDLTVTDDDGATGTDSVVVTVNAGANQPPVADAGPDQTVRDNNKNGSEDVTLDGSGSYDPDGTIVGYVWKEGDTQIATGVSPTVTLSVAVHTIDLTVTDDGGATATDTVVITVKQGPGGGGP